MNIKYISLLSLLCVASAQCTEKPVPKKLDLATNAYRDCRRSLAHFWGYGPKTCDEELKVFEQVKREFLKPHHENMQKEEIKCQKYNHKWGNTYWSSLPNIQKKYQKMYFKMDGHKVIIDAFDDQNGNTFLNSKKSTDEFAKQALDNNMFQVKNECSEFQLRWMSSAHDELMEMIKQQA